MTGCSAPNCSNSSNNKDPSKRRRMFCFPTDQNRRQRWIQNCRRDKWIINKYAYLCEDHFENSQFESHRADGWRKLKPNAIPTIFDVPNPPQLLECQRIKGIGMPKDKKAKIDTIQGPSNVPIMDSEIESENFQETSSFVTLQDSDYDAMKRKIQELEAKCATSNVEALNAKESHEKLQYNLNKFLSGNQVTNLIKEKGCRPSWSDEDIVKGLKLRFSLSKHGYNYLLKTGYPAPSYSTLNKRIKGIEVPFGILWDFINLMKVKGESMDPLSKDCILSVDEMVISSDKDYDPIKKVFVGNSTLGPSKEGTHYTVLLLRGLKSPWKQIVGHEVTAASTCGRDMVYMTNNIINAVESAGFRVLATVSDMGSNNRAQWKNLGVKVNPKQTQVAYQNNSKDILVLADVPHLLKNLKRATLSHAIKLSAQTKNAYNLNSDLVMGSFIKDLWMQEIDSKSSLRSLHHLKRKHLFPTKYQQMNVGLSVQFFSIKTAAAIEKAVIMKLLPQIALTTAWWIKFICQWFEVMTARCRKKSITKTNRRKKIAFLNEMIAIFKTLRISGGWKPLNTGVVLSTTVIIKLSEDCLDRGYDFFLSGRTTQDALENVFSQIRRKAGSKPTALQSCKALKLICVSQYLSDVKSSNYANDADRHLLNFTKLKKSNPSISLPTCLLKMPLNWEELHISTSDQNDIYYIAGATVNALKKRRFCDNCLKVLEMKEGEKISSQVQHLLNSCNLGGLKKPSCIVYNMCLVTEKVIIHNKHKIVNAQIKIEPAFINEIVTKCKGFVPDCCSLTKQVVEYYLNTRCIGIRNHLAAKHAHDTRVYASSSANKKSVGIKK